MTRLELIKLIGDVLTKLDVLRGSLLPDAPDRLDLDRLRRQLDRKQLQLVQNQFDENTQKFQNAIERLEAVNKELKKTINDVEKVAATIANLKRFVKAVDEIIGAVAPFV